jgi:hypothetical protein
MAHKTKKLHDNEMVVQLKINMKCMKSTNLARIYPKIVAAINADWECVVMDETGPAYVDNTQFFKDKQDAEGTPS